MLSKLRQIWEAKDLRSRIFFVLGLLVIYRIVAHIPIPGVDASGLASLFEQNQVLGLLNIFSGGALSNLSIVMLSVGPYITASIVMQLLAFIVPKFEELSKEGEQGRNKINQYTRWLTLPFAVLQGYGTMAFLSRSGGVFGASQAGGASIDLFAGLSIFEIAVAIIAVTTGSMFTMWLGEIITEKNVGNGISLLIFAGIIAGIPTALQQTFSVADSTDVLNLIFFAVIALVTIAGIVFITEGQRNIPIAHARAKGSFGQRGSASVESHLPIRVNQAGVIPIIFAISVVIFPSVIAQFFISSSVGWIADSAQFVINLFADQLWYGIIYFAMVVAFTYFYTYVIFKPDQIAENLQKRGAFIPGIRPGGDTEKHLAYVSSRLLLAGALFLGVIAVLPLLVQEITGLQTLTVGGTSLLIVVSVAIETVKQIDSQLVMRDYASF